ncbi:MAG TPA: carboxypeptidase-like regulatory domain-containing protein [Vicinamibacterales bacterium]|nr:carboxypeptidase-like regulatory domain-containing protein [Vicinamibacterales bacterium]
MALSLRYGRVTVIVVAACIAALAQAPGAAQQVVPPFVPPGAATKPPSGTGVISGVVVDARTGAPLTDAMVTLTGRGIGALRQLSDAKGRFIFSQLVAGDYVSLHAAKPGYFDGAYGARDGKSQPVTLADGQWLQDLRVELVRPGVIGGTVVDERGEPIVGAYVRALAQLTVAGAPHVAVGPSAKTDDRGMYRLAGLSAGRYVVEVPSVATAVPTDTPASVVAGMLPVMASRGAVAPDYRAVDAGAHARLIVGNYAIPSPAGGQPQAYPIAFYPNAAGVAEAAPIDLAAGQERDGIDFQLRPVPTWRISGRVDGPASSIAGLLLRLVPPGAEDLGLGSEAATALVEKNGTFEFLDVPAGRYTIDARRSFAELRYNSQGFSNDPSLPTPGFVRSSGGGGDIAAAPLGTSYTYTSGAGDATMWAWQPIEVGGADLTDVVVTLRRAVSMTGRVVIEDTKRAPTTPAAGGLPQAPPPFVMVEPADGSTSLGIHTKRPDPTTLAFAVDGLMRGRYLIHTLGSNTTSITWNGHDYTYTPIDTSTGQDITGVVITIDPNVSPAKINGSVANVASHPHGAAVIAFPAEPAQWTNYGFQPRRIQAAAVTNSGTYQLSVPAGDYYLIAVDGDRIDAWQDPRFLQAAASSATRVSVDWNETRSQALQVTEVRP